MQHRDIETIVEILAKVSRRDGFFEIDMSGRQKPDIDRNRSS
jgi:hypothetical protein